jgi:hypothetical protein
LAEALFFSDFSLHGQIVAIVNLLSSLFEPYLLLVLVVAYDTLLDFFGVLAFYFEIPEPSSLLLLHLLSDNLLVVPDICRLDLGLRHLLALHTLRVLLFIISNKRINMSISLRLNLGRGFVVVELLRTLRLIDALVEVFIFLFLSFLILSVIICEFNIQLLFLLLLPPFHILLNPIEIQHFVLLPIPPIPLLLFILLLYLQLRTRSICHHLLVPRLHLHLRITLLALMIRHLAVLVCQIVL